MKRHFFSPPPIAALLPLNHVRWMFFRSNSCTFDDLPLS